MIDLDLFERNQIDELRRETALMGLCKHPNILKVYGSFVSGSKLYIATPYLSGGSCLDIMKNGFKDGFEEITIATILKQALEGLIYLHKDGHIHRDVKAGNLLMDDQGTVLLSDFGVSSSLTENSEIRKTFVGTPCWMAPEVMEQSGYDFKADIWSFGITAIELATGHAPFAKYPPMKVLMMTLNQSPPTLNRDQTKFKYSRLFKDMIDLCLQKDPTKRPTADKLILHPFFKQAKRKDYLLKSILSSITPIEQRQHKKTAFKQTTIESNTVQWNFSENEERPKHITFGDAIIKKECCLPSPPSEPEITKKSRFVIEDVDSQRSLSSSFSSGHSPPHDWQGIGLGIECSEIKKGRFSVNQQVNDCTVPMSRVTSTESSKGRKSRFEISSNIEQPKSEPLTRESSKNHQRSVSNSSKIGRFSIEKDDLVHPHEQLECRKKGRFELIPCPESSSVKGQLETLLKQLETQKYILNDILQSIPNISRSSSIIDIRKLSNASSSIESMNSNQNTIDHLQQVLINSHQEKQKLLKENQALKLEIDILKKSNTHFKQIINLPPKKVMASKLAAAAAAAALNNNNTTTVRTTTATIERSEASSTSPSVKRRLSETNENTGVREKKATKSPMMKSASKSITHSERIVLAEISQYKSYFEDADFDDPSTQSLLRVSLEYPGLVEPESFLLLRPVIKNSSGKNGEDEEEDKDEYNPITDLLQSCEFIYDCYLTEKEQQLFGDQSHGIMRNLTKYRNRRSAVGFKKAVEEFNKVMIKLKANGALSRNAKEMRHPNYDLACHILFQVYSRTVARQAEALNNYQAFSNNVYGEINPSLVKEFITKTNINSDSVFMDLGCGIGNVVLQVAAQTGCEAYGIEIMETPCKFAKRQLKEYAARMKAWRLPTGKIHFRHGDFLDVAANDLYSTLKRSDVLLVNNYAFDAATNQALAQLFLDLKEGTKIISLKSFVPKHHKINQRTINMPESILRVDSFEYYSEAVSWTNNGGRYYIATVDRLRLKPFYDQIYQH
ncbi:hypothetical protein G6F62_001368 [Rhizopus arrhizus]|nr:hypothetical protein G6F23_004093 [Rhizopus arrhizus]KAG0768979.1 hypothetical protein G6F24_001459 [Rhizopus arrhizus]KAG0795757.1 hypothetical protein G6F21_001848 [Rhizopus arrhizus]KAG0817002.1 hypothetical protein G6F20_002745 [Rhizopus arrhizus]KAG0837457.1 hypothetical protein G6F19_003695 [Rhizopus arrhizus]